MKDEQKTKAQLIDELSELRKRLSALEQTEVQRRQLHTRLKESQARYHELFRHTHHGVAVYSAVNGGADFVFVDINEAGCRIDEISREDTVGRTITECFPNAREFGILDVLRRVWHTGVPESLPLRRYRDGRITGWRENYVYRLPSGEVVAVYSDNTAEKLAEEALRESETLYRVLAESADDYIYLFSGDLRVEYVNKAGARVLKRGVDEIMGHTTDELFPPETVELQRASLLRTTETGQVLATEAIQQFPMGDRWLSTKLVPVRNEAGDVVSVLGVSRDITERKQAEKALRESETRHRTLFDQANDLILVLELPPDQPPIIRDANQVALSALGYTRDELCDKPISFVEAVDLPAALILERQRKVREKGHAVFEVQHRRKDGSAFFVEASIREITIGKQRLAISIERDLTERRRADEDMGRSREELQRLAARLQSTREEERTSLARELHDNLGQLLTAVKLDLGWLGRHLLADEDHRKQQAKQEKLSGLGTLIDQAYGVVRRVSLGLRPSGIDELGLWPALEEEAARFTERTGIACNLRPCKTPWWPKEHATPIALFRIVQEALTNVLRHAEATAVVISCTPSSEGFHTFSIVDNGRGIDTAQAASPSSIGLIGMRERAHSFGGQISVSGAPGKGTTVTVTIPAQAYLEDP